MHTNKVQEEQKQELEPEIFVIVNFETDPEDGATKSHCPHHDNELVIFPSISKCILKSAFCNAAEEFISSTRTLDFLPSSEPDHLGIVIVMSHSEKD